MHHLDCKKDPTGLITKLRMAEDKVTLLGFWGSPFALRVKWALKLKGIEYEYIEEDLSNKSPLLLVYNHVHKKVPVLVHNSNPVVDSLVIIEYIDEVWKGNPLLPLDPYQRAKARFRAKFAEDKCMGAIIRTFFTEGKEKEKVVKEGRENLKTLESALEGKKFFGGETIGYLEIASGWIRLWTQIVEEIAGVNVIDAETMPVLNTWFDNFLEVPAVVSLPGIN
ncbi:hypothetical protein P3X46_028747 [Hevea brasiliensis]|uniref:glutathione transferase n=1 Tax=Hevea brasiliensis TaxID=3981 RepID=A0ABQ9KQ06_HEVBR|nr:glutathione transferase GST 23 [Hevea brasiliensis]KAJ9146488.1 hypothetical protein P3X46_028747 [Hevea brasiliensis]